MQITDSDFTRPKDEYSSYFGRPYDVLVVSDDQTTVNMDPCYGQVVSKFRASKYNMVVEKYQWKDPALQISKGGRLLNVLEQC